MLLLLPTTLLLLLSHLAAAAAATSSSTTTSRFLWLTDNHVDLWGDVNNAADKQCAHMPKAQWESAVQGMLAADKNPDFIIFSGDFVHFGARNASDLTRDVILDTITDVTLRMQRNFPNIRLFPCLGNHDYDPSNNWPSNTTESSWLLKPLAKLWAPWLPASALKTVAETGWYSADVVPNKLRVISLQTNYWAAYNQFTDISDNDDLAHRQFVWLESELALAQRDQVKVYINGHHPPIGNYVSGNDVDMQDGLWPLYSMRYVLLVQKYADLIEGQFYGHDHVDEVRVQNKCTYATPDGTTSNVQSCDGEAVGNIYIGPAMTNCNDPSFRVWEYDVTNKSFGTLTDYRQYHYHEVVASNGTVTEMTWPLHYHWQEIYGDTMHNLSAVSWKQEMIRLSGTSAAIKKERDDFFARRSFQKFDDHAATFYFCNVVHTDLPAFVRCLYSATKPTE